MSKPGHPGRTTVVVGLLLALLLAVTYAVVSVHTAPSESQQEPTPLPSAPSPPSRPPASDRPSPPELLRPGARHPVRPLGTLDEDRSVLVNGRGDAELRYRRAPRNGTRVHFICTGCEPGTRLVEHSGAATLDGGPLADPEDATRAVDTSRPGGTTSLLVEAGAGARWTVTLTPFDAVPVHEQTFDALGDDVVAVRARADLRIGCGGALSLQTLARAAGDDDYAVVGVRREDHPGTWEVTAPTGTDVLVLAVRCPGRWTLTVP